MADGPSRPEIPGIKDTISITARPPEAIHRNGGSPTIEPEPRTTIDPREGQSIERNFMDDARRSVAIIAAKNSGIVNPTEEDIRRVSQEMEERARNIGIPKPEDKPK